MSPAFLGSLSFFWKENNMKKLLSLLGAVGLIATSSATVVSCGDPDKGTSNNDDNNGGNDDDKYPDHTLPTQWMHSFHYMGKKTMMVFTK
jgi:hypothetical protein